MESGNDSGWIRDRMEDLLKLKSWLGSFLEFYGILRIGRILQGRMESGSDLGWIWDRILDLFKLKSWQGVSLSRFCNVNDPIESWRRDPMILEGFNDPREHSRGSQRKCNNRQKNHNNNNRNNNNINSSKSMLQIPWGCFRGGCRMLRIPQDAPRESKRCSRFHGMLQGSPKDAPDSMGCSEGVRKMLQFPWGCFRGDRRMLQIPWGCFKGCSRSEGIPEDATATTTT